MEVNKIIKENSTVFYLFVKIGLIPCSEAANLDIFIFYESLKNVKSKMDRYTITAEQKRVSVGKVRQVVRAMERNVTK